MKQLTPGLAASLQSGSTTLCWCWKLTRADGIAMGFTDHDRDVDFGGLTYEAVAGFTASEIKDSVGLNVDNLDVTSALSSQRLDERDLAAGLYDDARVEIYRVDWQQPTDRVLMRTGSLGEVQRAGTVFSAEVRGLAHYLQQPSGRLFQYTCDADVGDGRCKIDLDDPLYKVSGSVSEILTDRRISVSGLDTFEADWFARGLLGIDSGAAAGQQLEVKAHTSFSGVVTLEAWQPFRDQLAPGDLFTVTVGCDKTNATCAAKFSNIVNFRGFPHMPGNDFVTTFARPGGKAL